MRPGPLDNIVIFLLLPVSLLGRSQSFFSDRESHTDHGRVECATYQVRYRFKGEGF